MNAVIDPVTVPNVVVIMTDDDAEATDVATRYAGEVGYQVLVVSGTQVAVDGEGPLQPKPATTRKK